MAYVIGLLTPEEMKELERRGWELEEAPKDLIDKENSTHPDRMKMVWVDASMFDVMNGPDWEKGPKCEHEPDWSHITPADGAPGIVDVMCKKCHRLGGYPIDAKDIDWGEED